MGTLYDQPPRKYQRVDENEVNYFMEGLSDTCEKYNLNIDQAIKIYELLELKRQNDLFVANGDIHDEQMAGMGDIFKQLSTAVEHLSMQMENWSL